MSESDLDHGVVISNSLLQAIADRGLAMVLVRADAIRFINADGTDWHAQ